MSNNVIVIGGNHHNTLSVLRSLGVKDLNIHLILVCDEKDPYVSHSKYIKDLDICENISDIGLVLNRYADSQLSKAVVIACSDAISSYLDSNYNFLSKYFILPGSKWQGRITEIMNKQIMSEIAVKSGLNIPKSWTIMTANADISQIEYPCIVKPLTSKNGTKADIVICNNNKDLKSYLNKCTCSELQIQIYVDKQIEYQLIGCSINCGERVIIPGASIILRQPENTNTGFLKYVPRSQFKFDEKSCKEFIQNTGYSGLFSLEFLRGKDGKDYFMEINFRNDGNAICVLASGINLPYIWYQSCLNNEFKEELNYGDMKQVIVMPEFDDFQNVKLKKISLFKWIKDVVRTDRFMEFDRHDPQPFFVRVQQILKGKTKSKK